MNRKRRHDDYSHRKGLRKYGVPSPEAFDTGAPDWVQWVALLVVIIGLIVLLILRG